MITPTWIFGGLVQVWSNFAWTNPGTPALDKNKSVWSLILRTTCPIMKIKIYTICKILGFSSTWWRGCRKGGKNEKSSYQKLWHDQIALLDRLSLLGLRECKGSSYVLQQSKKHLGMVQCTFVVFFLTFFFQATCGALLNKLGKKAFFWTYYLFGVLFSLEILKNFESCTGFL